MDEFSPKCPVNPGHEVTEVIRKRWHPGGNFVRFGAFECAGCEKDIQPVWPSRVIADFTGMWSKV